MICNYFYIIFDIVKRSKHSHTHLNLGRLANVCFAYIQVGGNSQDNGLVFAMNFGL